MNWIHQLKPFAAAAALFGAATACGGDDDGDSSNADDATPADEMGQPSPGNEEPGPDPSAEAPDDMELGNLVEVAQAAGDFETLLAAAEAADLVGALSGEGPLTVFAPTDAAFAALPDGTLEALLADPDELAAVLSYHVVAGELTASEIADGDDVDTLLGPWLDVEVSGGQVTVAGAQVVTADIEASNGTIHVIDSVLLPPPTIAELAAQQADLSTLVTALQAADLVETLEGEGPFTVFAPTNAAFDALPEGTVEALLEDTDALSEVLLYHVVAGRKKADAVAASSDLSTLQGEAAPIEVNADAVLIAGAKIAVTNIQARNGIVHLLDAVMLPPNDSEMDPDAPVDPDAMLEPDLDSGEDEPLGNLVEVASAAGSFETLLAAAEAAGLVDTLSGEGPLTVFAPTDDAFAALPEGSVEALLNDPEELAAVLSYHVIAGELGAGSIDDGSRADTVLGPWLEFTVDQQGVTVGDARVISADVPASNGVIHVIDSVLLPPPTIASLAAQTPELSTLVTALEAAGLTEALSGEGPLTVFAPTNAAFEALPDGTLEGLLEDTDALSGVLLYHVVGSRQSAASVLESTELMMLSGDAADITMLDGGLTIAGAPIGTTDIVARNGIIHLLDGVMLPPSE